MFTQLRCLALTAVTAISILLTGCGGQSENEVIDQSTVDQQAIEDYDAEMNSGGGGV